MHCPRCGQQQISVEIKFCSRCGFPLGLISEVLAHGGFLPQLAELHKPRKILTRRNGIVLSIFWAMFFVLIMTPLWGIMDVDELAGASAIIGIFGGLMILIGSMMLLKKPLPENAYSPQILPNYQPQNLQGANFSALPPPVENYMPPVNNWRAPNTDDLVKRGSVTDHTTKLLHKDE